LPLAVQRGRRESGQVGTLLKHEEPERDEMNSEQNVTTTDGNGMPWIVAGVHGTAASDAAMDWAAREARLRHAQLRLVLVRDPGAFSRAPYAHPAAPAPGDAEAVCLAGAGVRASLVLPRARVITEMADGLPAKILSDRAAGASLLVLGAAPAGFLGPVARACLREAPCPVVIVVPDSEHAAATPRLRPAADPAASMT
jgi:nucleotide-binding universal stress UspA family protein